MSVSAGEIEFPLNVFVRCGKCGKGITGSFSRGRRGKLYPYYFCRTRGCRAVNFRRDDLHAAFEALLQALQPADELLPLFRAVVKDVWQRRRTEEVKTGEVMRKRVEMLKVRKQQIFDAFIDKQVSKEVYDSQTASVQTLIDAAEDAIPADALDEQELYSLLDFAEWMLYRLPQPGPPQRVTLKPGYSQ